MANVEAIFRPVRAGDIRALAEVMRHEDAAEVRAAFGVTPLEALRKSIEVSAFACTAELGGEVAAIFGIEDGPRRSLLGPREYDVVWLLTGRACAKYPRAFFRASRRVLTAFLELRPVLANMIDARYSAALRWARHLGAEVRPAQPWGVEDLPFHPVIWRRSSWAQQQPA